MARRCSKEMYASELQQHDKKGDIAVRIIVRSIAKQNQESDILFPYFISEVVMYECKGH